MQIAKVPKGRDNDEIKVDNTRREVLDKLLFNVLINKFILQNQNKTRNFDVSTSFRCLHRQRFLILFRMYLAIRNFNQMNLFVEIFKCNLLQLYIGYCYCFKNNL